MIIKKDKILHSLAGMAVALIIGLPCWVACHRLFPALWTAVMGGVVAGSVKEFCDKVYRDSWNWRDFMATAAGVVAAVLVILALQLGHSLSTRTLNDAQYHTSPACAGGSSFAKQQTAECQYGIRLVNPMRYETAY